MVLVDTLILESWLMLEKFDVVLTFKDNVDKMLDLFEVCRHVDDPISELMILLAFYFELFLVYFHLFGILVCFHLFGHIMAFVMSKVRKNIFDTVFNLFDTELSVNSFDQNCLREDTIVRF